MNLPRYPDYKHSGVDWLGEVPSHWKIERLKNTITLRKNTVGDTKGDYTLLSLTLQGVVARDMVNPKGKFPAEFDTYQVVEKDDLVFCLFDVEETPRAVGISPCTGMVTGAYTVGRVKVGVSPQYLYNFYLSRDQYKALKMYYTGLRNVIRSETFNAIPCPVPPINEQIAISKFLEKETAKIDTLVAEQEKLIELLKEKRQTFISNAVTRGIDPQVKVKDSGVEWLGEIPENWDVRKASNFFTAKKGTQASQLTKEYCSTIEGEYPVYSGQTENNGVMSEIDTYEFDSGEEGCLFATTVGAKAMTVSHIKGKFSLSQNCMIIVSTQSNLSIRFYYYHLQALFLFERALIPDHIQPSFRMEDLYSYRIAVPPLNEQERIVEFLDTKSDNFSKLITEASNSIDLLKERRSALISAAVTGQIDVRNYQLKEPA